LSEEQKAVLHRMAERQEAGDDSDIDFSDIPPLTDEQLASARRGGHRAAATVRLREDLRVYFADLARRKRVPMDDLVNDTLAKAVEMVAIAEVVK
jgi:hypothetical protein